MNKNQRGFDGEFPNSKLIESATRFETMVQNDEKIYFDEGTFGSLAEYFLYNGRWDLAMKACNIGLTNYPNSIELTFNKVQLFITSEEFDTALDLLDEASVYHPGNDVEINFMRGVIHNLMGDAEQAIEILREVLLLSEEKDSVYFQLGQTFQNSGQLDKAIYAYKKSIKYNIENELAFYELIYCIDQRNKIEEYLPYFQSLSEEHPFLHSAWFCLGMCYGNLLKHQEAVEAYEFSVAINDNFSSGWFNLGHAYMNTGRNKDALRAYNRTLELEIPTAEVYTHLAAAHEKLEDYKEAYKFYKEATKLDENYEDAWYGIASVLYEEGRCFEAIHFVKKAIALEEDNADYWLLLADTEAQLGNILTSVEAYSQAANYDATNPDIWLNWSLLHFEQKELSEAFEVISDGISELPTDADLHYRAVVYLVHAGEYKEAYHFLETALTLDYERHTQLYDFFDDVTTQKNLFRIIQQFKA